MSKHKHYHPNNRDEKTETENQIEKLEEVKEEIPADPFAGESVEELQPPQDLNLKLQLEKENSVALTNMLKTLQADFDNYRKRNEKVKEEAYEDGQFSVIKRMFSCFDAVEGALKSIKDENVKEGIKILQKDFLNAFESFGVKPIHAEGQMFDANLHNAIATQKVDDKPSGIVLSQVQTGFKTDDKVLRYSLVVINK